MFVCILGVVVWGGMVCGEESVNRGAVGETLGSSKRRDDDARQLCPFGAMDDHYGAPSRFSQRRCAMLTSLTRGRTSLNFLPPSPSSKRSIQSVSNPGTTTPPRPSQPFSPQHHLAPPLSSPPFRVEAQLLSKDTSKAVHWPSYTGSETRTTPLDIKRKVTNRSMT